MFNRFTQRARTVVILAREAAAHEGAAEVTSDHVLLGALARGGAAATALTALGVDADAVRGASERVLAARLAGLGVSLEALRDANDLAAAPPPAGSVTFALESRRVLEEALRVALERNERHIGDEHILLALLRDERSTGARVLAELGVPAAELRWHVDAALEARAVAS